MLRNDENGLHSVSARPIPYQIGRLRLRHPFSPITIPDDPNLVYLVVLEADSHDQPKPYPVIGHFVFPFVTQKPDLFEKSITQKTRVVIEEVAT